MTGSKFLGARYCGALLTFSLIAAFGGPISGARATESDPTATPALTASACTLRRLFGLPPKAAELSAHRS